MPESRRKFRRFKVPLGVSFRPTYGARDYFTGTAVNLSCEGLGLDAHDFRFFVYENLELHIEVPGSRDSVSLIGDVLWKKQIGKRCLAGIKFKIESESMQKDTVGKIFASTNISMDNMYSNDPDTALTGLPNKLGFIKQYHEGGTKCKVTFRLPREMAHNTRHVAIVGDFNKWDASRSPMTRLENGDFVVTIDLDSRREYKFRYLIDGLRWENDWYADRFVPNDHGSKDSVVIV